MQLLLISFILNPNLFTNNLCIGCCTFRKLFQITRPLLSYCVYPSRQRDQSEYPAFRDASSDGSNNVRSLMFVRLKPKIGCSSSISKRWTRWTPFSVRKNYVRVCSMFDKIVFNSSLDARHYCFALIGFRPINSKRDSPRCRCPAPHLLAVLQCKTDFLTDSFLWNHSKNVVVIQSEFKF